MNPECEGYKTVPGKKKKNRKARKAALRNYRRETNFRGENWLSREEFIKQQNSSGVENFTDLPLTKKIKIVRTNIESFQNQEQAPATADTLPKLTKEAVNTLGKQEFCEKLNKYFKSYTKKKKKNVSIMK